MTFEFLLTVVALFASTFALPQDHVLERRASLNQTSQTPNYTFDQLYNLTIAFMDQFMYPNNVKQAKMINSTILSEDILGRVDATRDFTGRELNTEYIFGLFANIALNPNSFTMLGYPINYTVTHFTANQNIVSVATVVDFELPATNTTVPQELDIWITFNSKGEISQYDL